MGKKLYITLLLILGSILVLCILFFVHVYIKKDNLTNAYREFIKGNPKSGFIFTKGNSTADLITKNLDGSFYLITKKKFQEARTMLETILKYDPNNPIALNNLAGILLNETKYTIALSLLEKSLQNVKNTNIKNLKYFLVTQGGSCCFNFFHTGDGDASHLELFKHPGENVYEFFAVGEGALTKLNGGLFDDRLHESIAEANDLYLLKPEIEKNIKYIKEVSSRKEF